MPTDNTTDPIDPLEALLESGKFTDETDVTELAAALNGTEPDPDEETQDKAGKADEAKAADEDQAAAADKTADADEDTDQDAAGKPFDKNDPLYKTLTGTRRELAAAKARTKELEDRQTELDRTNQELLTKVNAQGSASTAAVQAAADAAGLKDDKGNDIDVSTIDIDALRETYDGPIVDVIAALQQSVQRQGAELKVLRTRESAREQTDEELLADSVQRDIDSIPSLADWQVNNPRMWARAQAEDDFLRKDPEWANKSRVERFQEVARSLGEPQKPAAQGTAMVDKARKDAAARAAPISLSELPSGTAAGQSESETLEEREITQLADMMSKLSPEKLDELLERHG